MHACPKSRRTKQHKGRGARLEGPVELDVAGEGVVAALVHEPAAASRHHAQHHQPGGLLRNRGAWRKEKPSPERVQRQDLHLKAKGGKKHVHWKKNKNEEEEEEEEETMANATFLAPVSSAARKRYA